MQFTNAPVSSGLAGRARSFGLAAAKVFPLMLLGWAAWISVRWLMFLASAIPPISRGDFLWAMWHRMKLIESGEWGSLVASWFELFGGHIVLYTRILQSLNYVAADYSGSFVK